MPLPIADAPRALLSRVRAWRRAPESSTEAGATTKTTPSADSKPPRHGPRLDALDGIRTIAVALVVLFHVSAPGFSAGYLGVDMFFVLSGYLITGRLLPRVGQGRFPLLADFWTRRFKRLLPAALLVIVVVLLWSAIAAPLFQRAGLAKDAWWTVLYLANWHFIDSASYFANDGTSSPLLHMWSLALEEQFYLGWPLLISLVAAISLWRRRGSRHGRGAVPQALAILAFVVVVASAVLLWVRYDPQATERAYMGTDTKTFEPMLGAFVVIALYFRRIESQAQRFAKALAVGGALGLVVLYLFLPGPSAFYFHGGALLFSLAASALIVGVAFAPLSRLGRVLSLPAMSYLGRISYGIYLWHWPYAVWLGTAHTTFTWWRALLVVVLTLVTAAASYHFLEMPIRQGRVSSWVTPRRALAAMASGVAAVAVGATVLGGAPWSRYVAVSAPPKDADSNIILLVGDSVPLRLTPDLSTAAAERGFPLVSAAAGGCSPIAVKQWSGLDDGFGLGCGEVAKTQEDQLKLFHPGIVLWWSRYEIADRFSGERILHAGTEEFWKAQHADFERAVDRLTAGGATLVVVQSERPGPGVQSRCTAQSCPPFLERLITGGDLRDAWNEYVRSRAAVDHRIRTITVEDLFCHAGPTPTASPSPSGSPSETAPPAAPRLPAGWNVGLCDDTVSPGRFARPDGSHFDNALVGEKVAAGVIERTIAAARGTR